MRWVMDWSRSAQGFAFLTMRCAQSVELPTAGSKQGDEGQIEATMRENDEDVILD